MVDPLEKGVSLKFFICKGKTISPLKRIGRSRLTKSPSAGMDDREDQPGDEETPEDSVVETIKIVVCHCEAGQRKGFASQGFLLSSKPSATSFKPKRSNVEVVGMPVLESHPMSR
jgi:hypothetical protein